MVGELIKKHLSPSSLPLACTLSEWQPGVLLYCSHTQTKSCPCEITMLHTAFATHISGKNAMLQD